MKCPHGTFFNYDRGSHRMKFPLPPEMFWGDNDNLLKQGILSLISLCYHHYDHPDLAFLFSEEFGSLIRERISVAAPCWSVEDLIQIIYRAFIDSLKTITGVPNVAHTDSRHCWKSLKPGFVNNDSRVPFDPLGHVKHVFISKSAYEKVTINPVIRKQFGMWRSRYGADFIDVVSTGDDVRRKGFGYKLLFFIRQKE